MDKYMREQMVALYQRGLHLFPIREGSKEPAVKIERLLSEGVTASEYSQWTFKNYGVICGPISGICVLDVDGEKGWNTLSERGFYVNDILTPKVTTPRTGGMHLYFRYNPHIRTGASVVGEGVDIRSLGGYVVGPGSTVEGKRYEWVPGYSIEDYEPEMAPKWMLDAKKPGGAVKNDTWKMAEPVKNGARNTTFISFAGSLVSRDMAPWMVMEALQFFNERWCETPMDQKELEHIASNAERYRPMDSKHREDSAA
jgi:hypothetical protein